MSEHAESYERHHSVSGAGDFRDIIQRVVVLETRFAVMDKGMERLATAMETTNKEIHEFRELIAKGKGAWWGAGAIIGFLIAVAGAIGALVHKLLP